MASLTLQCALIRKYVSQMNVCLTICRHTQYYLMCRYAVKVQDDHLVTLQMSTSKRDVYIKLQVLDHEQEQLSATGKGHVILPAFIFQKDAVADEDSKRSSSRTCKALSF